MSFKQLIKDTLPVLTDWYVSILVDTNHMLWRSNRVCFIPY